MLTVIMHVDESYLACTTYTLRSLSFLQTSAKGRRLSAAVQCGTSQFDRRPTHNQLTLGRPGSSMMPPQSVSDNTGCMQLHTASNR